MRVSNIKPLTGENPQGDKHPGLETVIRFYDVDNDYKSDI